MSCAWCKSPTRLGLSLCDRCYTAESARRERYSADRDWAARIRQELADQLRLERHASETSEVDEWREDDNRMRQADFQASRHGGGL